MPHNQDSIFTQVSVSQLCNSGKLARLLPSKIVPGENETLLRQEKLFQGKVMVERVSVNLKGPLEYDSEAEERPASPSPDSETLYALIFNVSFSFQKIVILMLHSRM